MRFIKLAGGLGNLLFQYAFGQYIGKKHCSEVKYFIGEDPVPGYSALVKLVGNIPLATDDQLKAVGYKFYNSLHFRLVHKLLLWFPWLSRRKMVEVGSSFKAEIAPTYTVFDGYWQSYKYIDKDFAAQINWAKHITDNPYAEDIRRENSVFLHIRRGDYLKIKGLYHQCSIDYFKKGAEIISQKVDNPTFFIFSNDIAWVKSNLNLEGYKVVFVENTGENSDLKDLYCMANCKHGVIANSTFSWWAGYLISSPNKIIIAPKQWYETEAMNKETTNLIPTDWLRI